MARRRTAAICVALHVLHVPQQLVVLNLGCVPMLHSGSGPQFALPPASGLNDAEPPPGQPA